MTASALPERTDLTAAHRAEPEASGLSAASIAVGEFYSVHAEATARGLLGRKSVGGGP